MKQKIGVVVLALVLHWGGFLFAQVNAEKLSAEGKKVVEYLLSDWSKRMRSTSIALAMRNLEIEPNDDLRLEVGEYLRNSTHLSNNLKWWGANNYILSPDEKLIAKLLINTHEREKRLPKLSELVSELGLPEPALKQRLSFMARAGLLSEAPDTELGFKLIKTYARWGRPLRYNFHIITIGDGKPFEVW